MAEPATAEPIIASTTIFVQRSIKLGSADDADESAEGESTVLEVHKFAVQPAEAEAGLSIRKSQQTDSGDWVAGELTIKVRLACYNEEVLDGSATERAYEIVKGKHGMEKHLPKMLEALNQLSKTGR